MVEPRYAGLAYASVDGAHGAGGWQVHSRSAGLDAEDEKLLTGHVVTAFDSHLGPLPRFVEPEVLLGMPLRFSAEPTDGGTIVRCAGQAGADATGRPGNVFTTVLLDRDPGGQPLPIRLWRSPDLLVPFGAAAVAAASPVWQPRPDAVVSIESVAGVLGDPAAWAVLAVLLDAVADAVTRGTTVVLVADRQDDAALLLGAVCLLTSPAWSSRLHWSLYERGDAVDLLRRSGTHVVVIPAQDESNADPGVVVIDVHEEPELGVLGAVDHRTRAGSRVPVTHWSELVTELFALEPAEVAAILREVASHRGMAEGEPAWWLAAALVRSEECPDDVRDVASALLRALPAPQDLDAPLRSMLWDALQDQQHAGSAELQDELSAMSAEDGRFGLVAERFVHVALADRPWLDSARTTTRLGEGVVLAESAGVAAALRSLLEDDGESGLVRLTNVIDVLDFAGLLRSDDARIDEPLSDLVLRVLTSIGPPDAQAFAALLGRLSAPVRTPLLRDVADVLGPRASLELPTDLNAPQVLDLFPLNGTGSDLALAAADALLSRESNRAVADRVAQAIAGGSAADGSGRRVQEGLHVDRWSAQDQLVLAGVAPAALPSGRLVETISRAGVADLEHLRLTPAFPPNAAAALRLRLAAVEALADEHWRLDSDREVLEWAEQLAKGGALSTTALLRAPMRLLPVIALLVRRFDSTPGRSSFERLLKQRMFGPRFDPLPPGAVAVLASRLRDPDVLASALAYAAADRTAVEDDALRPAARTVAGDLLDLTLTEVLPALGRPRIASIVERAEELSQGRRFDRLLRRSAVSSYLDELDPTLHRKVR